MVDGILIGVPRMGLGLAWPDPGGVLGIMVLMGDDFLGYENLGVRD